MATLVGDNEFGQAKQSTADFFFARLLPKTLGLEASIASEASAVMTLPDEEILRAYGLSQGCCGHTFIADESIT